MKMLMRFLAPVLLLALGLALLGWSMTRSLDFIQNFIPDDQILTGYLGLAATGGGAVIWLIVFTTHAQSIGQFITAGLMTALDLLGEIALFTADSLYQAGNKSMIATLAPDELKAVIIGLNVLIGLNIIATFAFHLTDSKTSRRIYESVMTAIFESFAMLEAEKRGLEEARARAPQIASEYISDVVSRHGTAQGLGLIKAKEIIKAPEVAPVPLAFSQNGNGKDHHA